MTAAATIPQQPLTALMGVNSSPVIDVIVPVYRGMAETRKCIESILAARTRTSFELIVINDASPDPALVSSLEKSSSAGNLTLYDNDENLGFVATVNRGMAMHTDRDVLLLNSDTVVANDWLDRIIDVAAILESELQNVCGAGSTSSGKFEEALTALVPTLAPLTRATEIDDLLAQNKAYSNSLSWRITRPLRFLGRTLLGRT